jgi:methylthioribose-1-phosphate isomerase
MRTIEWLAESNTVRMIDQRRLPVTLDYLNCKSSAEIVVAIQSMAIRGAPALGVAAGFGLALDALNTQFESLSEMVRSLTQSAAELIQSRPTAVNLAWGVKRIMSLVNLPDLDITELRQCILKEALKMAEEDVQTNLMLAKYGSALIDDGDTIIHHCNTGSLAAVDWGTALGAIRYAHDNGKRVHVLIDETRPRLQGSRLTAWECEQYEIPYEIITDNAAGYFLRSGRVQKVFFGADRVAANGDVVNKVGTYMLSLAAHANRVPVISVFPLSSFDPTLAKGGDVKIEQRDSNEVLGILYQGERIAPLAAQALNPAFDITPHELISAMVTEKGVLHPPFDQNLAGCIYNSGLDG